MDFVFDLPLDQLLAYAHSGKQDMMAQAGGKPELSSQLPDPKPAPPLPLWPFGE